jgi:hypothetical protein
VGAKVGHEKDRGKETAKSSTKKARRSLKEKRRAKKEKKKSAG